ncbi:hypothetical protein VPH35_034131 [Triticum aestivum]
MATVASWWLLEPAISGATSCTVFCCNRPRHLSGGHELFWRNEIFAGTGILVCYNRAQGLLPTATAALVTTLTIKHLQNICSMTVLDDLPESVIIQEILVRLPVEDILRCRAVRKSWRHATTTKDFLLAHHHHQPSLPVIHLIKSDGHVFDHHLSVFCHTSPGAASRKLNHRTILRYPNTRPHEDNLVIHAVCDGLLIISFHDWEGLFEVCNPSTRQRAPLPLLHEQDLQGTRVRIAGLYQHRPSGGYQVLYSIWTRNEDHFTFTVEFYIIAVGANEPRPIEQPPLQQVVMGGLTCSHNTTILYRDNLHWLLRRQYISNGPSNIMIFNTEDDTFRWLCHPPRQYPWMSLLELDGALSICSSHDGIIIDIYVMHDYEDEVWALIYSINMMALEGLPPLNLGARTVLKIVTLNECEMVIEFPGCVLHCDIGGKFLGMMEWNEDKDNRMHITPFRFQENICQLPFFATQDYGAWAMLQGDDERNYSIWP